MLGIGNNNITIESAADPDLFAPDLDEPRGFAAAGSVDAGQVINYTFSLKVNHQ